jgi:hypothetical protein
MPELRVLIRASTLLLAVPLVVVAGSRVAKGDAYADRVDDSLTFIDDAGCLGNCVGDPENALGEPDFEKGQGETSSVSLGPGGMLGLVFDDEPCFVDGDPNTPDIIVYEVGGISRENFSVDVVVRGSLTGNPVSSIVSDEQPERHLDLTSVLDGVAGTVDTIQIIDLERPPDEPDAPGLEAGWGADIDAVECISTAVPDPGSTGGTGGSPSNVEEDNSGCSCRLRGGNLVADGIVWVALAGLWIGYRRIGRRRHTKL